MNIAANPPCTLLIQHATGPRMDSKPRVRLGRLCMLPGTVGTLPAADILAALAKHVTGNWGDLPPVELAANRRALRRGDPVCSLHLCSRGKRLWIATQPDRALTTVMLADA